MQIDECFKQYSETMTHVARSISARRKHSRLSRSFTTMPHHACGSASLGLSTARKLYCIEQFLTLLDVIPRENYFVEFTL